MNKLILNLLCLISILACSIIIPELNVANAEENNTNNRFIDNSPLERPYRLNYPRQSGNDIQQQPQMNQVSPITSPKVNRNFNDPYNYNDPSGERK